MLMQCLLLITWAVLGPCTSGATSQVLEETSTSGEIFSSGENNVSTEWIFSPNDTYNAFKLEFSTVNISSSVKCREAYLELLNGTKYCGKTAANLSSNCYVYNFASTYNESCAGSCQYIPMNFLEPFTIKYFDSVGTSSFRLQYEWYKCDTEQQTTTPIPSTSPVTTMASVRTTVSTIPPTSVSTTISLTTGIVVCAVIVVIIAFGIALIVWNRKRRNTMTHTVPPTMPRNDPRPQQTRPCNSTERNRDVDYLTMNEINLPPSGIFGSPKARPKHTRAREGDDDYLLMEPTGPIREGPKYENLAFEGESSTASNSAPTTPPYYDNVDFTTSPNRTQDVKSSKSSNSAPSAPPYYDNVDFTTSPNRAQDVKSSKSSNSAPSTPPYYDNLGFTPSNHRTQDIKIQTSNPGNGHENKAVTNETSPDFSSDDENYYVNTEIRPKPAKTGLSRLDKTEEASSAPSQNSLDNSKGKLTQTAVAANSPKPGGKTGFNRLESQDSDNKDKQPNMTPIALELHQKPRVPFAILQNVNSPEKDDEKLSSKKYPSAPPTPPPRDMDYDTPTGQDTGPPPLPSRNLLLGDDTDKNDPFEEDPDAPTLPSRDLLFGEDPNTNTSSEKNPNPPSLPSRLLLLGDDPNGNAPSLPPRTLLLEDGPNENGPVEVEPDAPSLPPRTFLLEDGPNENDPVEVEPDAPALPPRMYSPGYRHANHPAYEMWWLQ